MQVIDEVDLSDQCDHHYHDPRLMCISDLFSLIGVGQLKRPSLKRLLDHLSDLVSLSDTRQLKRPSAKAAVGPLEWLD